MHLFLFPLDLRKRLDYSKKMHIHIPATVWIQFLGVLPQIHILKSNPGIMVSENRPSRANRSWGWGVVVEPITKRITAFVRQG